MKYSINEEIKEHILDYMVENNILTADVRCKNELHQDIFNTDYYLIGYYNCNEWLKKHNLDTFTAIEYVQQYEKENFGETTTEINSEKIVNMIAYIIGEEIIYNMNEEVIECYKCKQVHIEGYKSSFCSECLTHL